MIHVLLQSAPVNPPGDTTMYWILVGLAAVTILYTVFRPSLRRKDPLARSPSIGSSLAQQRGVEREMQNLLVELSEMSRQISAQLDTRAARLEELLRQTDEKIARLNALHNVVISQAGDAPTPPAQVGGDHAQTPAPPIDPRHQEIYDLADQGMDVAQIARQLDRPSGEIELIMALRAHS